MFLRFSQWENLSIIVNYLFVKERYRTHLENYASSLRE